MKELVQSLQYALEKERAKVNSLAEQVTHCLTLLFEKKFTNMIFKYS